VNGATQSSNRILEEAVDWMAKNSNELFRTKDRSNLKSCPSKWNVFSLKRSKRDDAEARLVGFPESDMKPVVGT